MTEQGQLPFAEELRLNGTLALSPAKPGKRLTFLMDELASTAGIHRQTFVDHLESVSIQTFMA